VRYPEDRITRVGEALAEIDWCRHQILGLGPEYPWRTADLKARLDALEARLEAFYPWKATFHGEPVAILRVHNRAEHAVRIRMLTTDGTPLGRGSILGAGESHTQTHDPPGPLVIEVNDATWILLTEPYTELAMQVP
jgi:hypothetical protein